MSFWLFCSYFWVQTPRGWDKDNILISNYTIRLWFDKFYTLYGLRQWYHFTNRGVQTNHLRKYPMPTRSPLDSKLQSVCRQVPTPAGQVAGFLLQKPINGILESSDLYHRPNWPTFIRAWNWLHLFMSVVDCGSLHLPPNMSRSSSS